MRITVLGATGSVGMSTLDLVGRAAENVRGRGPHRPEQRRPPRRARDPPQRAASPSSATKPATPSSRTSSREPASRSRPARTRSRRQPPSPPTASWPSIVGAAGLRPTFAAARQGRRVALANKECLVSAGNVFLAEIKDAGTELIPVDSEHSAAFQAIGSTPRQAIERITLTASGGPFRTWDKERLAKATRGTRRLKHPNWSMGAKITIDSATFMNKGLELIEAYHLFPVEPDQLDVVVHPQSIVHCLVALTDGSVLAQLGSPDMRTPIALALAWPARMTTPVPRLDLVKLGSLTFEAPDEDRFPALRLAREALKRGGGAPAVLNAANEIAVEAFLDAQDRLP